MLEGVDLSLRGPTTYDIISSIIVDNISTILLGSVSVTNSQRLLSHARAGAVYPMLERV